MAQAFRHFIWGTGEVIQSKRAATIHSPGGTGGLRVGADLIAPLNQSKIWVSTPTWANHKGIFTAAGFEIESILIMIRRPGR